MTGRDHFPIPDKKGCSAGRLDRASTPGPLDKVLTRLNGRKRIFFFEKMLLEQA